MDIKDMDTSSESKVMKNKELNDNVDLFEHMDADGQNVEFPSATNTVLSNKLNQRLVSEEDSVIVEDESETDASVIFLSDIDTNTVPKSNSLSENLGECGKDILTEDTPLEHGIRCNDRKLSFDHSMLSRREGLSQSVTDLHSLNQFTLETKTSFFKKKMGSFVKNTTEIFRRQSQLLNRRRSPTSRISVSLHSLNVESVPQPTYDDPIDKQTQAQRSASVSPSFSDLPLHLSEESLVGSRSELVDENFADAAYSATNLNDDADLEVPTLCARAISMSSGLDSANRPESRKSFKANRVSWLASETVSNYFRRATQDGKNKEIQSPFSYQDFGTIPENNLCKANDTKGRRYSYVRAVSRDDSMSLKKQESSFRKKKAPENEMSKLTAYLNSYTEGVPPLEGFKQHAISQEANEMLVKLSTEEALDQMFSWIGELNHNDTIRQGVIKELIYSEALHIHHLQVIVSVYIAAAHDLQKHNYLMDLNTGLLFQNIPDVLNANIIFWEKCIYPMVHSAHTKRTLFDTGLMIPALQSFEEIFKAYTDYIYGHSNAIEYLRSMTSETPTEFSDYIQWCNANTENRLQLADMLVKPFQRLTKYSLLIGRIASFETDIQKKIDLENSDILIKKNLNNVNRSVAQKDALLELADIKIEPYEPDFKNDEDLLASYRRLSKLNLFAPMVDCATTIIRSLIYQGDLRFKDAQKEFDAHIFLFTDYILICKKISKSSSNTPYQWKLVRPKIFLQRVVPCNKLVNLVARVESKAMLMYIVLDEHGAAKDGFTLQGPSQSLKLWDTKFKEALMTFTLLRWYQKNPNIDIDTIAFNESYKERNSMPMFRGWLEMDPKTETTEKTQDPIEYKELLNCCRLYCIETDNPDVDACEKSARTRVAVMMQPNNFMRDTSHEHDLMMSGDPERGPYNLHSIMDSERNHHNAWQSRSSAFHQYITSNDGHEEENAQQSSAMRFYYRAGSFGEPQCFMQRSRSPVERMTGFSIASVHRSPSITVNKVPDTGDEAQRPPTLVLQQSSPRSSPGPRSASAGACSENIQWLSPTHPGGHSMPDINVDYNIPEPVIVETASERLYRSHQELVQKNRLAAAGQHYLSPDHRGSSYPPPSPTRASLKRGLAFSYSFKSNPPLTRSQNVGSTSSQIADVPRRILGRRSPQPTDQQTSQTKGQRTPSPTQYRYGKLGEKPEKKKSTLLGRSRDSNSSENSDGVKGVQSHSDFDDGDRNRRGRKTDKEDKHTDKECIINIDDGDEVIELAGLDITAEGSQASGTGRHN